MATHQGSRMLLGAIFTAALFFTAAATAAVAAGAIARPSNPGGPGDAVNLTGNPVAGARIFVTYCQPCHGAMGKKGVANPGSDDGRVPPLNPIDATLRSNDPKVFTLNLDLYMENGSTPEGSKPQLIMAAWGKDQELSQQQIADVIAYIRKLNMTK